ncbi:hypothetical protein MHK_010800 [Candidatus Magnetomorum sp. HK-1]|nr:hypothetical protein MHK_010800 [Candidatus Magnetomorum sp. HK-1]
MPKQSPIEFMITNRTKIHKVWQKEKDSKKTWLMLKASLPELHETMKLNTFKQYLPIMNLFYQELEKESKEKEELKNSLEDLKIQNSKFKMSANNPPVKLDRVRQKTSRVRQKLDNSIKINGWNVRKSKDGYFRCYRKIRNKVESIYIGKTLDKEKTKMRIREKEKYLRLQS